MALKITKENENTQKECYVLKFLYNEETGHSHTMRMLPGTYKMLEDYFKPKEIKDEKVIPEFDKFWTIHPKGNKATAKQRFIKVMKKNSVDELESKLWLYIKSNDYCYLKGLDVWLNPEKEHWNDPIVKKEDKFKKEEKGADNTSFFR